MKKKARNRKQKLKGPFARRWKESERESRPVVFRTKLTSQLSGLGLCPEGELKRNEKVAFKKITKRKERRYARSLAFFTPRWAGVAGWEGGGGEKAQEVEWVKCSSLFSKITSLEKRIKGESAFFTGGAIVIHPLVSYNAIRHFSFLPSLCACIF